MKLFTIGLLLALSCFAGTNSATLNGWAAQSPVTSALTSVNDMRVEMRVHDLNTSGGGILYLLTHFYWEAIRANTTNQTIINSNNSISYAGRSDFIVRAQRCASSDLYTLELWNSDGTNYVSSDYSITLSPANWSLGRFFVGYVTETVDVKIAYVRVWDSCVPLGTVPTAPGGNVARWELESGLTDASGVTGTLSTTKGTVAYTTTPVVGPTSSVDNPFPTRTGSTVTLVGSPWHPESTATCRWNVVAGPQYLPAVRIADNTACSTTATGTAVAGDYTFRLTASTSLASTSTDVHRGVVATDSNGVVVPPSTLSDAFLEIAGDVTRMGTSPWSWYDYADVANANQFLATIAPPVGGTTALAGTVTLSPRLGAPGELNPIEIAGTGTSFTTDFAPGDIIWLWCSFPDQPVADARWLTGVGTVSSDTRIIAYGTFYHILPTGACTNVQYSKPTGAGMVGWSYGFPGDAWTFYDSVTALYRLWLRTGLDVYRTGAQTVADWHWRYVYSSGYDNRTDWIFRSFYGSVLRAEDGKSEWWTAMPAPLTFAGNQIEDHATPVAQGTSVEARVNGYQLGAMSSVALYHPDSGVRTTHCAHVKSAINNFFAPAQLANGAWYNNVYTGNRSYPYAGPGTFTWHLGVTIKGLKYAYLAMVACGETATAATALTTMENAAEYVYSGGRGPNRTTHYDTGYFALGQNRPTETGTVDGSSGGTAITGSGTSFQSTYACNGTDYIAFDSNEDIRLVSSCSSQTSLTISTALSSAVTASTYRKSLPADTGAACDPSNETYCELALNDRQLTRLIVGHFGWLYKHTGALKWKTYGDELFSSAFGGPASGPGYSDTCAGPDCDGDVASDFIKILPPCSTSSPPCGGTGGAVYGKDWAMASGTGGAQNHLAYRLGGLAAEDLRTYQYGFVLPSGADKIQLEVMRPNGATVSPASCTTSPCAFTYDARQGQHLVRHTYQTTGGATRGVSDWRVVE